MKKEGFIDFGLKEAFEYQTVASIVSRILRKGEGKAEEAGHRGADGCGTP